MRESVKEQLIKALFLVMVTCAIMLAFEVVFMIPEIENAFIGMVNSDSRWLLYAGLWLLMFLQTTIIPIPALTILVAAKNTNLITMNFMADIPFYIITMTAYIAGVIVAYWMGRKWGRKAVKWVAGSEEEYEKWAGAINNKGKWFYFLTVLLPIAPDDLLCFVAGSVKLDFKFFIFSNMIARTIGLVTTVYILLTAMTTAGSLGMAYIYLAIIAISFIMMKIVERRYK